jgi:cell division septum initiation protein DivIVA
MRSSTEEVNQFLHTVHQDLEGFLTKHKKEHNELNLKVSKLSEVGHKTLDNVD